MAKKRKLSSFERSFVAARRSGAKEFSFGGKQYSTKQKGEGGGGKSSGGGSKSSSSDALRKSKLSWKASPEQIASRDKPQTRKKATSLNAKDIPAGMYGSAQKLPSKNAPTPTPRPDTAKVSTPKSSSSGHNFGVVGRVGEMGKRIFSSTSDPKKLFKDREAKANVPTPTPRPASPSERQAKRTEAYLTNVSDAPAVGESTFAKSVHGMENLRPAKPKPALTKQQRSDSEWNARDVADTRKRMEEAKTPRPGKTGGVPSENRFVRGSVSVAKAPQGKVMDGSTNRGTPSIARPAAVKSTQVAASGKTARLPQNEARTTPKTGRLKKTTVVARK